MSLLHTSSLRMNILLERLQGLDFTRANQQPAELGLNEDEVFIPSPSGGRFLRRVFAELGVVASDSALDIGCAKGSALRDLLRHPFARVDGIELSPALAAVARRNFSRLGVHRVDVFCMDARAFTRYGDYTIYYLYNPFPDAILDSVLQQLTQQAAAADPEQERIVVYNNPLGHNVMLRHGFTALRRYPDFWGHGIQVYSNRPGASRLGRSQLA